MAMDIRHNIQTIRQDFPALFQEVNHRPLIYFDNAATTLKPLRVINSISDYYLTINSNVHRGVHTLSQKATDAFEESRKVIQNFIHAREPHEIIFTRGTTESINLLAMTLGKTITGKGDNIIVSGMEHHANLVPWQVLCKEKDAALKVIPVTEQGFLDLDWLLNAIDSKTKLITLAHVSNVLGTINPVKEIIDLAHRTNIPVIIDGAQAVSHLELDMQDLDCDFYCFSGHKCYGPMGIGVFYGKEEWLEKIPPFLTGGEMVKSVNYQSAVYNELPYKFEAGTPDVAGAIGLAEALYYIKDTGLANISLYESQLLGYARRRLTEAGSFIEFGAQKEKAPVISFNLKGIHHYDAGMILDKFGVAVRTGTHCAQPLVESLGQSGMIRASLAFYNTIEEIDRFTEAILQAEKMLL